jgi:hypothetical protein
MAAGFKIKQLYRVGLAQTNTQPCVKCSLDFFGIAEINGIICGFAVEVKARVTGNTSQYSRELAQDLDWMTRINYTFNFLMTHLNLEAASKNKVKPSRFYTMLLPTI